MYNRYPDPHQLKVKRAISTIRYSVEHIFLSNGSDECIDLLFPSLLRQRLIMLLSARQPYGMYGVSANINNVMEVRKAPLTEDFQLDLTHLENLVDAQT